VNPANLPRTTEAAEHAALFAWRDALVGRYPDLWYMLHVPNSGRRNRHAAAGLGMRKGWPDVTLFKASGGWPGLAIELKVGYNKPSPDQAECMARLEADGWWVELVTMHAPGDWVDAARIVAAYLGLPADVLPSRWRGA
jgi:hypothetical protein